MSIKIELRIHGAFKSRHHGRLLFGKLAATTFFLLAAPVFLNGCAGAQVHAQPGAPSAAPPNVEQVVRTDYLKKNSSIPQRPDWIDNTPEKKDGFEYFVGLSEYHVSEAEARTAALQKAITEFAKTTGVEVSDVDIVFTSLYGKKASEVLDPTITKQGKNEQKTNSEVSRIKAKQWYWETYDAVQGQEKKGTAYKYYVLVTVPEDEYARVQEWKRQQQAAKQQAELDLKREAETAFKALAEKNDTRIKSIYSALARAELVQALREMDMEGGRLFDEKKRFESAGGYYSDYQPKILELLTRLLSLAHEIQSSIVIDTGMSKITLISDLDPAREIRAWVWLRQDGKYLPVRAAPLLLANSRGEKIGAAQSGENGRAVFRNAALKVEKYRIQLDIAQFPLSELNEKTRELIGKVNGEFTVQEYGDSLDDVVAATVNDLFYEPSVKPLPAGIVIVGPVTFGNTNVGGEFSAGVERKIQQSLLGLVSVKVAAPVKRTTEVMGQAAKSRDAVSKAKGEEQKVASLGSAAVQASVDGASGALVTTYEDLGEKIRLNMELRQASTDYLLSSSSRHLKKRVLPGGLAVGAESEEEAPGVAGKVGKIRLEVTPENGEGRTYREKDKISFFVTSDTSVYLLMVYKDAGNNLVQILPNKLSGQIRYEPGDFIQVPGKKDNFDWIVEEPFGVERLYVFAATQPFPALPGEELPNGLRKLGGKLGDIFKAARSHGTKPGVGYGEANTVLTTIKGGM